MIERSQIEEVLKTINDPEIGLDIVNLGLVYEIMPSEGSAEILMTLTTPYCPLDKYFLEYIPKKLQETFPELQKVTVRFTFEPPWTKDRISPDARMALGLGQTAS